MRRTLPRSITLPRRRALLAPLAGLLVVAPLGAACQTPPPVAAPRPVASVPAPRATETPIPPAPKTPVSQPPAPETTADKPAPLVPVTNGPPLPGSADPALKQLEALARTGDPAAQLDLADSLAGGAYLEDDTIRPAIFWYREAAQRGEADASWSLADLYRHGIAIPEDMVEAVAWYRRAADLGHAEAMFDLGLLHLEGSGVERNLQVAARWFEQAADAGIARALYMLGILYEQGVDGAPDHGTAAAWYRLAADAGDRTALVALDRLAQGERNVEIAEAPAGSLSSDQPPPPELAARAASTPQAAPAKATPPRVSAAVDRPVNKAGMKEIQTRLRERGYRVGRPDGILGKRTTAAIRAFQRAEGLRADGRPSQDLLRRLRGEAGTPS